MAVKIAVMKGLPDGVALIQWKGKDGMLKRGYVPTAVSREPSSADLKAAIPYGDLISSEWPRLVITPKRVLGILNKKGVWMKKQLDQSPHLRREAYSTAALQVLRKWEKEQSSEGGKQEVRHG